MNDLAAARLEWARPQSRAESAAARRLPLTAHGLVLLILLTISSTVLSAGWLEDFSEDPSARGWRQVGDASLFSWNPLDGHLEVTWDSSRSNSYFLRSLDTVLTKADDFSVAFDLRLTDATVGVNPNRPFTFQIAAGLTRLTSATDTNLQRGIGIDAVHGPRNLAEFTWFPDSGFGATVSPSILSSNNQAAFAFAFPLDLDPGAWFHVQMDYTATNRTLRTTMTRNGASFGPVGTVVLGSGFSDFRLDHFAVSSYSEDGADGSLLAHGVVDNVAVVVPPPAIAGFDGVLTNGVYTTTFTPQPGLAYRLQRSEDLITWTNVAGAMAGDGATMTLMDGSPPAGQALYRVIADKP